MKKRLNLNNRQILYYIINLCSYGDRGDYELFPSEDLDLNPLMVKSRLKGIQDGKWSGEAGQFSLNEVRITLYRDGRVIMEGVKPDTSDAALSLLEEILVC